MPARSLVVCLALVAGILAAASLRPPGSVALLTGAVAAIALLVAWLMHRRSPAIERFDLLPRLRFAAVIALLLGFAFAGFALAGIRFDALDKSLASQLDGHVIELRGTVVTDPEPQQHGIAAIIRASSLGRDTVRERIELRWHDRADLQLGDRISLDVRIRKLDQGELFDRILYRKSVAARATSLGAVQVEERTNNPLIKASNTFRTKMARAAKQALGPRDAGLLMGLVVGDRRDMSSEVEDDFRATGLSHLTAVSGANVAMVLGAVFIFLRLLRAPRKIQIALGLATVGFFAILTRLEPSVMRACVMAGIALAAFFFGRISNPLNALGSAAVVLLLLDPFLVWSVAFQLSVAATAGILLISPIIRDRSKLPRWARDPLAILLGAQIPVIPLVAAHFGTISLVSLPANLLAGPMVAPATVIGFVGGAVSPLSDAAGRIVLSLSIPFVAALRLIASSLADLPFASTIVYGSRWLLLAAAYLFMTMFLIRGRRTLRIGTATVALLIAMASFVPVAASPPRSALRITFFDVGQGDAALVESPAGARVLIDGGPHPTEIAGRLLGRGVDRIDLVVFSHAHQDHVRGLESVMKQLDVRVAIHPGVDSLLVHAIGGLIPSGEGERFEIGDLSAVMLGPSSQLVESAAREVIEGEGSALNDASLVVRIDWNEKCALFPGDLEEPGQEELIRSHRNEIECEVLKAPHHGSAKLLDEFVDSVDPETTVISVGPNLFGHPTRKAITLFERSGSRVLRTDRQGDVVVEIS